VDGGTLVVSAFSVAGQSGPFVLGSAYNIPGVGSLTINANGSYSFAPVTNYTGSVPVITYTVSDGNGGTDTSTLTLSITPVNDAPVANPDIINVSIPVATTVTGLSTKFYNYNESTGGGNLGKVGQAYYIIDTQTPNATFITNEVNFALQSGDLGVTGNLANWIAGKSSELVISNPLSTNDALVHMEGLVYLSQGSYNFRVTADDGYSIKIDGVVVAEVNANQSPTTTVFQPFNIASSGLHQIEIIYWDQGGQYVLQAEMQSNNSGTYFFVGQNDGSGNGVIARNDAIMIDKSSLLANDTDVDDPNSSFSIVSVGGASQGTVSLDGSGNVKLSGLPDGYSGTVTFNYTMRDHVGGLTSSSTVTVNIDLNAPKPILNVATTLQGTIFEDLSATTVGMTASNIELLLGLSTNSLSSFNPPGSGAYAHSGNVTAFDGDYASNTYLVNAGQTIGLNWVFNNAETNAGNVSSGSNDLLLLVIRDSKGNIVQGPQLITSSEQLAGAASQGGVFNYTATQTGAYEFNWIVVNGRNSSRDSSVTLSSPNNNPVAVVNLLMTASVVDFVSGSDTLGITISGVPVGAFLTAGTNLGSGTWSLTSAELHGLQMVYDTAGSYNLLVTATATDPSGNSNTVTSTVNVQISSIPSGAGNFYDGNASGNNMSNTGDTTGHYYSGMDGNDTQSAGTGHDVMYGGAGNDNITGGGGNDIIYGGIGDDTLTGGDGNDLLFGEIGNDSLIGGIGNDVLYGGVGTDNLNGGTGNDFLIGGKGNDTMTGGGGVDTFIWLQGDAGVSGSPVVDTITDFKPNPIGTSADASILDFSDLFTNSEHLSSNSLDQYLNFTVAGGNTTINIDPSGAGNTSSPSLQVVLQGVDVFSTFGINPIAPDASHQVLDQMIANKNIIVDA
jgi:hypothetical protein